MCITKIRKLEHSLETQEQYIKYLYATIDGYESEIENLRCLNRNLRLSLKNALSNISLKEEALQALEKQLAEAESLNIQLKIRISEILQNSRKSKMARHHMDAPDDLQNMDSDELLTVIRNSSMQMSIDIITRSTTPDETRQARELRERVVNSAWILYRKLSYDLDEALTQLGMELDENDAMQREYRANEELMGILHNSFQRKRNKKLFWKTQYNACVRERDQYRADRGLLEYNRDQLYDRYLKWKQKTQAVRNDNQNLNQQLIALQNIPPVINQATMAGYPPPRFAGRAEDDLDEFIKNYRLYLTASGITTANPAGKQRASVLWQSCLTGDASNWRETKIAGKKFRLNHVACGANLANMAAVVALNNARITAAMINAPDGTPPPALPALATGATVIPAHNVHVDEDWSLAGGCAVDAGTANNFPNGATTNNNPIVLPDINISQEIYLFRTLYTTVVRAQQEMIFGTLTQGSDSIREYYRKICKYAKLGGISEKQKRLQFIRGLTWENKLELKRLGLARPLNDELIESLEDIESQKNEMLLDDIEPIQAKQTVSKKAPEVQSQGITTADIDRIVNARLQALQPTQSSAQPPALAFSPHQDAYDRLLAFACRLGLSQHDIDRGASLGELESFIDMELRRRLAPDDYYHHTFQTRKVFGMNASMYEPKSVQKASSSKPRKCSNCGKSGHTKSSCPKNKKGKKKTNYTRDDSSSSSSSSYSDSSDNSDSDAHICYGLKKKDSSKKKSNMKKPQLDKNRIINEVFQLVLKAMVESFVNAVPKDTVISVYNAMNAEFINFKEPILSQLKGSPSIKTREKIWDSVKEIFAIILQPMVGIVSNNLASNLIRKEGSEIGLHINDSLWFPAGIGIVNRKSASDIITIKARIIAPNSNKTLVIPKTIFDTGSDSSLVSSNIVKRLELDVDKTNAPDLSGVATKSDTLGTVYGLGISIYDSENDKTIEDDFMVIKSDKDFLLLGVPWIDRAEAILDCGMRELSIPISQRKKVTIPISLHKRKTNVTALNIDTCDLKKIRLEGR